MSPLKVIIDNWPSSEAWYIKHTPTIIALLALIISITSLYWGRKQFRNSTRPYAWLMNFVSLDTNQKMIPHPDIFAIMLSNSPARINKIKYEYYYISKNKKEILASGEESNLVRFPSPMSQNTNTIEKLQEKLKVLSPDTEIKRNLRIDYSSLSGKEKYFYESESIYISTENRWKEINEKAF